MSLTISVVITQRSDELYTEFSSSHVKYFLRPASHWAKGLNFKPCPKHRSQEAVLFTVALSKDGELGGASLLKGDGWGCFDALDQHGGRLSPPPLFSPFAFRAARPVSIEMAAGMTVSSKLRGLLMQRELPGNLWGAVAV